MFGFIFGILGALFGGPIGYLGGSLLGSFLDDILRKPVIQIGPRLDDLKVQTSTYGIAIGRIYGLGRKAGNIIWATDLVETPNNREIGDKVFLREFRYTVSFAIGICKGVIDAMPRLWLDGKLFFDVSPGANEVDRNRSNTMLDNGTLVFYFGTATQTVNPTIDADDRIASGLVPAYRGLAYVVFTNFDLTDYYNRLPQVTVEASSSIRIEQDTWEDISSGLNVTAFVNAGVAIGFDRIYIVGGNTWSGSGYGTSRTALSIGEMQSDGSLDWDTIAFSDRQFPGVVFSPGFVEINRSTRAVISTPDVRRLYVIGGYEFDELETYSRDADDGDMLGYYTVGSKEASFQTIPVRGRAGGKTKDKVPLPRDSFAIGYHASVNFGSGLWLFGGRCSQKYDARGNWLTKGPGSTFNDLWFFDGRTWELLSYKDPGTVGYRTNAVMLSYKGDLYLAGGQNHGEGGEATTDKRDIWRLVTTLGLPRFGSVNSDILTNVIGGVLDWPNKTSHYISGIVEFRGSIIVMVTYDSALPSFFFFISVDNGSSWDVFSRDSFDIEGWNAGTSTYTIDGDQTSKFVSGDTLTIVNDTDLRIDVYSNSSYDSGTGKTSVVISSSRNIIDDVGVSTGEMHINRFQDIVLLSADVFDIKPLNFVSYRGVMYVIGGRDANNMVTIYRSDAATAISQDISVGDVVSDICTEAGLQTTEIDVTGLTDTIVGYIRSQRQTAREALEVIRRYVYFDTIETDGKIVFIKRGVNSSAATITDDNFSAHVEGRDIPDKLIIAREQDLLLPQSIEVTYFDVDLDHQENTQKAQRIITTSNKKVGLQIPIIMDANKAKQIAEVLLYESWMNRSIVKFTLSYEYLYLNPADIVTLVVDSNTFVVRILKMNYHKPGLIDFEGAIEDLQLYGTSFIGGAGSNSYLPNKEIMNENVTIRMLLDIPILQKSDDDIGFYFGAFPEQDTDTTWKGSKLVRVYDNGTEKFLATAIDAIISGIVDNSSIWVIADHLESSIDESSILYIILHRGTIATNLDAPYKEGINLALIGDEIIQFVNAESLGNNKYKVTDLNRGLYGTEWAVNTHGNSETFVLLERDKLKRVGMDSIADVGEFLNYKVVPLGKSTNDYSSFSFQNNAIGKKPYAPYDVGGIKNNDGDWSITFKLRSRGIHGLMDQPADQKIFSVIEIDILDTDATTVIKTYELDDPNIFSYDFIITFRYVANQQIDDFGSKQDRLKMNIYQISGELRTVATKRGSVRYYDTG